jgi:2'-5' RNA ligase
MKNYTLLLMVSGVAKEKIEFVRQEQLGTKLVDDLPPHLTIRGRFILKEKVSEEDLVNQINKINIDRLTIASEKVERIGNANVICLVRDEILDTHLKVLSVLEQTTTSIRPEREKENFTPHVTLFRSAEPFFDFTLPPSIDFDQLSLFEIDPTVEKKWSKLVTSYSLS